jgi:hypothetical protein
MALVSEKVKLTNVRLSFPSLFKPAQNNFDRNKEPKYEATFLVPKEDKLQTDMLKAAIERLVKQKWPSGAPKGTRYCVGNGDEKEYEGYAGTITVKASSKRPPMIVNRDLSPIRETDNILYPGCYVNATVTLFAMDDSGIRGVFAWINAVQFSHGGAAFSGGVDVASEFEVIGEAATAQSIPAGSPGGNPGDNVPDSDLPF